MNKVESPEKTDDPNTPRISSHGAILGRVAFWLVFYVMVVVVPLAVVNNLLNRLWQNQYMESYEQDLRETGTLLSKFDQQLDRDMILTEAMKSFQNGVERFLVTHSLGASEAQYLDNAFRRKFRHIASSSELYWFDAEDRLLQPANAHPIRGWKAWQAFYRALAGKKALSEMESTLANTHLKSYIGEFATMSILLKARKSCVTVLSQGRLKGFSILTFHSVKKSKKQLGAAMIFFPISMARHGWVLNHAVAKLMLRSKLRSRGELVGGFWNSKEENESSEIHPGADFFSPGLMHGLYKQSQKGNATGTLEDIFYQTRMWNKDPDLMLCVGIPLSLPQKHGLIWTFAIIRGIGLAVAVFSLFLIGIAVSRKLPFNLNLVHKFRLGIVILAGVPLLSVMIAGIDHSLRVNSLQKYEIKKRLENDLTNIEQGLSNGLASITRDLDVMVNWSHLISSQSPNDTLQNLIQPFIKMGLREHVFVDRKGRIYPPVEVGTKKEKTAKGITLSLARSLLRACAFEMENIDKAIIKCGVPAEVQKATDFQNNKEDQIQFVNSLTDFQFGGMNSYLYGRFISGTGKKSTDGFVTFSFNRGSLQRWFIKEAWTESRKDKSRIYLRGMGELSLICGKPPPKIREFMDIAQHTGEEVFAQESTSNDDTLLFVRPMKGVDIVGASISSHSEGNRQLGLTRRFLLLIILSAVLAAGLCSALLQSVSLKPLLNLRDAVIRIDNGDYQISLTPNSSDELGNLTFSVNSMAEQLREKARMRSFLRKDLISQSGQGKETAIARRRVAVLFAGLREFTKMEAALPPNKAMAIMSRFLGMCEKAVKRQGGEIDKFIGDTAMAIFLENGGVLPEHRAILAAVELSEEVANWMAFRKRGRLPVVKHGVGVAVGNPLTGHIGSLKKRLDFTAIGDTVNLAARLEKLAGSADNPSVLVSSETLSQPIEGIREIPTNIQSVRGKAQNIRVIGLEKATAEHG